MQQLVFRGKTAGALLTVLLLSSCGGGFFPSSGTITAISLSPTSAYTVPTGTQQFTATATYGNNSTGDVTSTVTWLSSATDIATVSNDGLVTGVALGNATITAKSNNVTATAVVTVSDKTITSITVSPSSATISLSSGQTQQFSAAAIYSDGSSGPIAPTWSVADTTIASISSSGLVSPVGIGSTTVIATAGGKTGTASVTVTQ